MMAGEAKGRGKEKKMKRVIITIKMPEHMAKKLRKAASDNYYMDLSEEIRSIIRSKWLQYASPSAMQGSNPGHEQKSPKREVEKAR